MGGTQRNDNSSNINLQKILYFVINIYIVLNTPHHYDFDDR